MPYTLSVSVIGCTLMHRFRAACSYNGLFVGCLHSSQCPQWCWPIWRLPLTPRDHAGLTLHLPLGFFSQHVLLKTGIPGPKACFVSPDLCCEAVLADMSTLGFHATWSPLPSSWQAGGLSSSHSANRIGFLKRYYPILFVLPFIYLDSGELPLFCVFIAIYSHPSLFFYWEPFFFYCCMKGNQHIQRSIEKYGITWAEWSNVLKGKWGF